MKLTIFGAGNYGRNYINLCSSNDEIVAIADNYCDLPFILGHKVIKPGDILNYEYDKIVICLMDDTMQRQQIIESIYEQLISLGVPRKKIILNNIREISNKMFGPRSTFMKNIAKQINTIDGTVAECGVFRGNFAALINELFPTKHLHLFDTFCGFDERDIIIESEKAKTWLFTAGGKDGHVLGSELLTLLRCPNYEMVKIHKGYVPDTFADLGNEKYCFVNLDMDLYAPTLSALLYFASRINPGGIILLHDYYCKDMPGIKKAVDEAKRMLEGFISFPIGDGYSLALMKT